MKRCKIPCIKLFVFLMMLSSTVFSQTKLIEKLISNKPDSTRSSSFLLLPGFGYSQERGAEIGIVSLYSFYSNKKDTITRSSRISGAASFTTKKHSNFQLKSDLWSPGNNYHYTGELRYRNSPLKFYGIGNQTLETSEDPIIQKFFRLNTGIEKRFGNTKYSGFNAGYENFKFTDTDEGGIYTTDPSIRGKAGGEVLFLGISQIIDSRNSNTYTTKGTYIKVNYSYAPDFFGGDNFEGSLLKLDLRSFKSLNKKTIFGINGIYHSLRGVNTPFYLMPQLGNDEIMRGYFTGRYRDENVLALQGEIRLRFHPRFGLAGFAGTGTVFENGDFNINTLKPNLGGGFRYFFDIERGLSIRMDYGIGEKRPGEKRQSGFYISLGEAF